MADAPVVPAGMVLVDHAWVKDASSEKGQAKRRNEIDILRTKAIAGTGFVAAWESLGANGDVWHVAEGETYDTAVIPPSVLALGPGTVSAVIPGDGGLHLFRLIAVGPAQ